MRGMRLTPASASSTAPFAGTRPVALYDGNCRFCTRSARRLEGVVGASRLEIRSVQTPGALDAFPGISHAACMKRLHLVEPDGRVAQGAEAVARAIALLPFVGVLAFVYYVPGLRSLADALYALVARYRYRLFGREACDPEGTCHLH
jgi:predicted DCC family thiol-disulfide oxidoreductase YuxK